MDWIFKILTYTLVKSAAGFSFRLFSHLLGIWFVIRIFFLISFIFYLVNFCIGSDINRQIFDIQNQKLEKGILYAWNSCGRWLCFDIDHLFGQFKCSSHIRLSIWIKRNTCNAMLHYNIIHLLDESVESSKFNLNFIDDFFIIYVYCFKGTFVYIFVHSVYIAGYNQCSFDHWFEWAKTINKCTEFGHKKESTVHQLVSDSLNSAFHIVYQPILRYSRENIHWQYHSVCFWLFGV